MKTFTFILLVSLLLSFSGCKENSNSNVNKKIAGVVTKKFYLPAVEDGSDSFYICLSSYKKILKVPEHIYSKLKKGDNFACEAENCYNGYFLKDCP